MKHRKVIFSALIVLTFLFSWFHSNSAVSASDESGITADYQLKPGETVNSSLFIDNKDTKAHAYTLSFEKVPEGFHGYFSLEGKVVDNVNIPAAGKSIINFSLEVPSSMGLADMSILLDFTRDDGTKDTITLHYSINQDYAVAISSNLQSIKAINGASVSLEIGVSNTGNKDLTELALQAELPYKWILENGEQVSLRLKPGETGLYKMMVTIPNSQQSGEYNIKISCSNSEISSSKITIPVVVSTDINYLWWIAGILVVLSVFTLIYFKKHGRR